MAKQFGSPGGTGNLMTIKTIGLTGGGNVGGGNNAQYVGEVVRRRREDEQRQRDLELFMRTMNPGQETAQMQQGPLPQGQSFEGQQQRLNAQMPQQQVDLQNLAQLQTPQFQNIAMQMALQRAGYNKPAAQPGFTLPQGGTRFDASGQQIANVPAAPEKPATPSQVMTQKKVDHLNMLQDKIANNTATKSDIAMHDKMMGGVAQVQISLGRSTGAERTAIAETEANLDVLDNLESLFNREGVKTGPVAGRIAPTAGLAGLTTDNQEEFMAATAAFKNSVIKDITGAQMSEVEAKRIMEQIPLITDPPARWQSKLNQTRLNLKLIQKRRSQVLLKSNITDPLTGQQGGGGAKSLTDEQIMQMLGGQ